MSMRQHQETPVYNVDDFHQRWRRARVSALRKVMQTDIAVGDDEGELEAKLLELYFARTVDAAETERVKSKDILLRTVFDYSRILAMSLSKNLKLTFEVEDFQALLVRSSIPCVQGGWTSRMNARVLSRGGCTFCPGAGADACDYWREALDGLVMGLGEKERLARHASVRHGDDACVDVFYCEIDGEKQNGVAWGPLPEHMAASLTELCSDFQRITKTAIHLKGLSEGVLYFEFKNSTDHLCGGTGLLTATFLRQVQEKFPGILLQEVTPRAVLGVE